MVGRDGDRVGLDDRVERLANETPCGTQAVGLAEDWIRAGRCRRVVVISADAVTSDEVMWSRDSEPREINWQDIDFNNWEIPGKWYPLYDYPDGIPIRP